MQIKIKIYIKKIDYFALIIYQVNKHGVSRRWSTEADVKDFKSGALSTYHKYERDRV